MCHEPDAVPPSAAARGIDVVSGPLTLTSADGTRFGAFQAVPEREASTVGVLILPDVRGLHPFYERLAIGFAHEGHPSLAIDYFGRTAGVGARGDDFPVMDHITRVRRDDIDADIDAAIAHLRDPHGGGARSIVAVGFCFGGRQAFFASRSRFGLDGVVGFYGGPGIYPNGALGPTQRAGELSAPILGLFGGADKGIPAEDVAAFDAALSSARVPHEIVVYPDAPHGFFDLRQAEHVEAATDAWRRVMDFVAERTAG